MAIEIFLSLIARQREEGNYVYESYLTAVRTYKEIFVKYGHQHLADQLPEPLPAGSTAERQAVRHVEVSANGSSTSVVSTLSQVSTSQPTARVRTDVLINNSDQTNQRPAEIPITHSNDTTMPLDNSDDVSISQAEAADIELELNEFRSLDQQELPLSDILAETLSEALQDRTTVVDNTGNE